MAPTAFFHKKCPRVLTRKYGAVLAWANQRNRVHLAHSRHQSNDISEAQMEDLIKQRQAVEAVVHERTLTLNEAAEKLQSNVSPPAKLMDDLEEGLNSIVEMQNYTKGRFEAMHHELEDSKLSISTLSATEKELRKNIRQHQTTIHQMGQEHTEELAHKVDRNNYLQVSVSEDGG
jgi:DNA repair exonuclease SbcCD ATPase subunit